MEITDERIIDDVRTELASDPRLPYASEIAVEAFGEGVALRGTVGSFAQQRAAHVDGLDLVRHADHSVEAGDVVEWPSRASRASRTICASG